MSELAPVADDPVADDPEPAPLADITKLQDRLPLWFRTRPGGTVFAGAVAVVLFVLSSLPLWHTDVWGHLAYGRVISAARAVPRTEPLMPLARGVEFVDTAWLSQLVGYLTMRRFGVPGLQFLAGACVAAAVAVLLRASYSKTRSVGWSLLGLAAYLWVEWSQLFGRGTLDVIIRPQMAAMPLFALTLAVAAARPQRWHWFAVPLMFAAWANLHGSFLLGVALLGLFALGRGGDVLRRTDSFRAIFSDRGFWRLVMLTELAAAAALLNPYGLSAFAEGVLVARNPNLTSLHEWLALSLREPEGQAVAGVAFMLLFLYRVTPRRIGTGEALAVLVFGGLALWTNRMVVWWGPVAAYYLSLHAAAVWQARQARSSRHAGEPTRVVEGGTSSEQPAGPPPLTSGEPRSLWTVTSVLVLWIGFALTPFAQQLLHATPGRGRPAVSRVTPLGAAEHLAKQPSAGLIFNTFEYGDYLLWAVPNAQVFVATHAHLVPPPVWEAYLKTISGGASWKALLDRYGVETIVLDRPMRQDFIDTLMEEPAWEQTYRDARSAVFRRRAPLP